MTSTTHFSEVVDEHEIMTTACGARVSNRTSTTSNDHYATNELQEVTCIGCLALMLRRLYDSLAMVPTQYPALPF